MQKRDIVARLHRDYALMRGGARNVSVLKSGASYEFRKKVDPKDDEDLDQESKLGNFLLGSYKFLRDNVDPSLTLPEPNDSSTAEELQRQQPRQKTRKAKKADLISNKGGSPNLDQSQQTEKKEEALDWSFKKFQVMALDNFLRGSYNFLKGYSEKIIPPKELMRHHEGLENLLSRMKKSLHRDGSTDNTTLVGQGFAKLFDSISKARKELRERTARMLNGQLEETLTVLHEWATSSLDTYEIGDTIPNVRPSTPTELAKLAEQISDTTIANMTPEEREEGFLTLLEAWKENSNTVGGEKKDDIQVKIEAVLKLLRIRELLVERSQTETSWRGSRRTNNPQTTTSSDQSQASSGTIRAKLMEASETFVMWDLSDDAKTQLEDLQEFLSPEPPSQRMSPKPTTQKKSRRSVRNPPPTSTLPTPIPIRVSYARYVYWFAGIVNTLMDLNDMVGIEKVKRAVMDIVLEFITFPTSSVNNYQNMALYGPPGTGKTTVANILKELYYLLRLIVISPGAEIQTGSRGNFIAGYAGQTALRVQRTFMEKILGSFYLLDEAYSLVASPTDEFGQEALAEIVNLLSQYRGFSALAFAGYEDQMKKNLFGTNPGLARRIEQNLYFEKYTLEEIKTIFRMALDKEDDEMKALKGNVLLESLLAAYYKTGGFDNSNAGGVATLVRTLTIARAAIGSAIPNDGEKNNIIVKYAFQRLATSGQFEIFESADNNSSSQPSSSEYPLIVDENSNTAMESSSSSS